MQDSWDRWWLAEKDLRGIMVPQCDAFGREEMGEGGVSCWEADNLSCKACNIILPHAEFNKTLSWSAAFRLELLCVEMYQLDNTYQVSAALET